MLASASRAAIAAVAILILGDYAASAAQQAPVKPLERPDPASVTIPNLSFAPTRSDIRGYDTHYFFHKPGVSYEKAFADFDLCRIYILTSQPFVLAEIPRYVPMGADAVSPKQVPDLKVAGALNWIIGQIAIQNLEDDFAKETINRCMTYKGYARYGTSKAIWEQINKGNEADKFGRMALIASGPEPTTGAIAP